MEFINTLCGSTQQLQEEITSNGSKKTLVTIERIREERAKNKWVTFDKNGEYMIQAPYANSYMLIPISFCHIDDIKHVLSYRWAGAWGQSLNENDAPVDFLCISATEKVWVDYLNHLNDKELTKGVIENMGNLYCSRPVHAKYLYDFAADFGKKQLDSKGLSRLLACLTRGWIWQEIAFTGPEVTPPDAQVVSLLVELIKTGSEVVRCLIDNGFEEPKQQNVNEVIKFAIDTLWRARNLADNESAYEFFIEDKDLNQDLIQEAIEVVKGFRLDNDNDNESEERDEQLTNRLTMKVLAAMDNLENANFTKVEDSFCASFSTLLQSNQDYFGTIEKGEVAPKDLNKKITDMIQSLCEKNEWDVELWQQCVIEHPLSQLDHPLFESIQVVGNDIYVHIKDVEQVFKFKMSYNRPLQGQELDKSTESVDGTHEILSLSYRINKGKLYVIGFQTKSKLRVVPQECLMVSNSAVEAVQDKTMSSRWTQTTWYSRDKDWLNVLNSWKKDSQGDASVGEDSIDNAVEVKTGGKSKKGGLFSRGKKVKKVIA